MNGQTQKLEPQLQESTDFQTEAKCKTIHMKTSFLSHANNTYIHMNGFALGLSLKRRTKATRKWAIQPSFFVRV